MKLNIENQEDAGLLARYLSGEMELSEEQLFEKEVSANADNGKTMETMKKIWDQTGMYHKGKKPDAHMAWKKLQSRFENDRLMPVNPKVVARRRYGTWMRYAAVALLLIGIGSGLYIVSLRSGKVQMVAIHAANGKGTLVKTLSDGSVVYLAPEASFKYEAVFDKKSRNVELDGKAYFDIAANPAKPFIINTSNATITVLGTAFSVQTSDAGQFSLEVIHGKVKVEIKNATSKAEIVAAGEKVTVRNKSLVKSKFAVENAALWYRQRLQFKDEPLQNIISVLNSNYSTNFVLTGEEIGKRKLTVSFNEETPETMTRIICLTLNLHCESKNGKVVLSEPN